MKEFSPQPIDSGPDTQIEVVEAGLRSVEIQQARQVAPTPEALVTNKKIEVLKREIADLQKKKANKTLEMFQHGAWMTARRTLRSKEAELEALKDSLDLSKAGPKDFDGILDSFDQSMRQRPQASHQDQAAA